MTDWKIKMGNKLDLFKLNLPGDLKKLSYQQCDELAKQVRRLLITTVSKNGGHLASSLGTVELTMAVHRVFDSPRDKIVWDVGHQAYTHKILTGRANRFYTLRKEDGLSGFCRPDESIHDAFISGHSSNAVSAALGIATAMKLNGDDHHTIAIVGDGASSGGLFYEGINNAGKSNTNIIVILNYNEMSISKNVGGMAKYLSTLRTRQGYHKTKNAVENVLDKTPVIGSPVKKIIKGSKDAFKNALLHSSTLFEDLGFEYIGPIDGHNIAELEDGLRAAKELNRPVLIQVNTVKGKGYAPAEQNPGEFHGIGSFEIATGNPDVVESDSYSSVMGKELCDIARTNKRVCAVTAAMKYGTGLQFFAKQFPDRFFDVGIAEEHAVTFCGGLAQMKYIPVFAVYSTFLQRSYDELIHDLAICHAHAVICVDRAGVVGNDGETHQGIFDVSFISSIPNTKIYSPSDYNELRLCLRKAINEDDCIAAVRYPRGNEKMGFKNDKPTTSYSFYNNGGKVLIVTYGRISSNVMSAVEILKSKDIACDVLRLVEIFPINESVADIISAYDAAMFFEESYDCGSVSEKYSTVCDNLAAFTIDYFVKHGDCDVLLDELGFSAEKIASQVEDFLSDDQT